MILAVADWPWLFAIKVPFAFLAFGIGLFYADWLDFVGL